MEKVQKKNESNELEMLKSELGKYQNQERMLLQQLNSMNMVNVFRRLDYLFKVIENKDVFESDFIDKCVEEIKGIMTPAESEAKDSE